MTERSREIESLFEEALRHDLRNAMPGCEKPARVTVGLQSEVASLLVNHRKGSDFEPWPAAAATQLILGAAGASGFSIADACALSDGFTAAKLPL